MVKHKEIEKIDSQTKDNHEKYTFIIEPINHLPSKRSYNSVEECASASLSFGQAKFVEKLVNVTVLQDGRSIVSWQQ